MYVYNINRTKPRPNKCDSVVTAVTRLYDNRNHTKTKKKRSQVIDGSVIKTPAPLQPI